MILFAEKKESEANKKVMEESPRETDNTESKGVQEGMQRMIQKGRESQLETMK